MFRTFFATIVFLSQILFASEPYKPELNKVNGLFQTWLVNDSTGTGSKPDFRIRRAEVRVSGNASEELRAFVMVDTAKIVNNPAATVDAKILQDLGIAYSPIPNLEIALGQFKIPANAESLEPSS